MKATRNDWKTIEMSKPAIISLRLSFSATQMEIMSNGLIPEEMEDKWFIFQEGEWFHFHRSWTGFEIYRFKAALHDNAVEFNVEECFVERDAERYTCTDDTRDRNILIFLIGRGLLRLNHAQFTDAGFYNGEQVMLKSWSDLGNLLF